jgi:hypothetical protein
LAAKVRSWHNPGGNEQSVTGHGRAGRKAIVYVLTLIEATAEKRPGFKALESRGRGRSDA